jgi:uncharacterized membrane protein YcaP (DUF421 family)
MDLTGIVVRVLLTSLVLLILVRATGKQSVRHGTTFEFVIAVIIGDLLDDAIWAEVSLARFLAAVVTLFVTHWLVELVNYGAGDGPRRSSSTSDAR